MPAPAPAAWNSPSPTPPTPSTPNTSSGQVRIQVTDAPDAARLISAHTGLGLVSTGLVVTSMGAAADGGRST